MTTFNEPSASLSGDTARLLKSDKPLDLLHALAIARRRLPLFVAIALLVFVIAVVMTSRAVPQYTATAKVMLDRETHQVTEQRAVISDGTLDTAAVDTEVEVLKSRQLAERVVEALNLDQDPAFNPALQKPTGLAAFNAGLKKALGQTASAKRQDAMSDAEKARLHESVVDRVLWGLSVRRSGLTYVIDISYTSPDPAKAALIANTFADRYMLEQLEGRFDATRQANVWLNDRLSELRGEVMQAEAAVEQYRVANNLLSTSGATLTEQEISTYNQQLATVRAQQAEEEARLRTARDQLARGSSGDDVGEALGSATIQQLRAQRLQISGQLAEAERRYGPRHPQLLQAQRELADVDASIQAEIGRIISNLEARVQVARERTASMSGSLGRARGTLAANNSASVRLNELQRNADAVKTLYESYLGRFRETSSQEGLETSNVRIVSRAKQPTGPSAPNVPVNLAIGFIFAIGAGTAAVVLAELLSSGLLTAEDIEERVGLPSLGTIPDLRSIAEPGERSIKPVDYVVQRPLSFFSESIRSLKTAMTYANVGSRMKVVVVTSALPGEGKSTTAMCLARSAAQSGNSVLLIDCDLRRRNVNQLLGLDPAAGLLEVLNGNASFDDTVIFDEPSGAWILPLARSEFTPRDVFGSAAMDRLLAAARDRFDLVLLDTAPALAVSDTRVLASKADAVIFLTRWRKTPLKATTSAIRLLDQAGGRVAGVVLSQVDMKQQSRYGYGDAGYYYGSYKKYYAG